MASGGPDKPTAETSPFEFSTARLNAPTAPSVAISERCSPNRSGLRPVLWVVTIVALMVNGLSISASRLCLFPDSRGYVELAADIAERFDFTHDWFMIRTPGYPALLALIFKLFDGSSPLAILLVQHLMVVAVAVLTALIAWYLTSSRAVALLAGLMCACNLQLLAFSNVVLTEVPYTLALVSCVCLLIRYHRHGGAGFLALASFMAGVAFLFRPVGQVLFAVCAIAAVHRAWRTAGQLARQGGDGAAIGQSHSGRFPDLAVPRVASPAYPGLLRVRTMFVHLVLAIVPASIAASPAVLIRSILHGPQPSGWQVSTAFYNRAANVDRLDSANSEALADIKQVIAETRRMGVFESGDDHRQRLLALRYAYDVVRNASFAESSAVIGQAGRDLMAEHFGFIASRTLVYAARTLLIPDETYRYQIGGAPGRNGHQAEGSDILDVGTYEEKVREYMGSRYLAKYLPINRETRATTPLWTGAAGWVYRHIQKGPGFAPVADSPYELFVIFCVIGGVASLMTRARASWAIMGSVVLFQVGVSAFLCGTVARYAVPIQPLMQVCAAFMLVAVVQTAHAAFRNLRRFPRRLQPGVGLASHAPC